MANWQSAPVVNAAAQPPLPAPTPNWQGAPTPAPTPSGTPKWQAAPALQVEQTPENTIGGELLRGTGLAARSAIQGLAALPATVANIPAGIYNNVADLGNVITGDSPGFRFPDQNQAVSQNLSDIAGTGVGLPEPKPGIETIGSNIGSAMVGTGGVIKGGQMMANAAGPAVKAIGQSLSVNPKLQLAGAATGEGTREVAASGALGETAQSPLGQVVASILGSLIPGAGANIARGTGIGPTIKGGTDPVTGEIQPGKKFLAKDTNAVEQRNAFYKNLPSGINPAREAAGKVRANVEASQVLKRVATRGENGIGGALANLDNADSVRVSGYEPTSGTLSNNSGLGALERTSATAPEIFDRARNNNVAIAKATDKALPKKPAPFGQPEDTQKFLGGVIKGKVDTSKAGLTKAEKDAADAAAALEGETGAIAAQRSSSVRSDAGSRSFDAKEAARRAEKQNIVDPLYDKIDREAPIDLIESRNAIVNLTKDRGTRADIHPRVKQLKEAYTSDDQIAKDTGKIGTSEIPGGPIPTPFKELWEDLKNINNDLSDQNLSPGHKSQLIAVKEGIMADLEKAGDAFPELKEANAAMRKHSDDFTNGHPVIKDPAETLDKYFAGDSEAKKLARLVERGDVKEADVRQYFISRVAQNGDLTPNGMRNFIADQDNRLRNFPKVKEEIEKSIKSISDKTDAKNNFLTEVKKAQDNVKSSETYAEKSDAGRLAKTDAPVDEVINNVLAPGGDKYLARMISEAKADKTGKAMEGLTNAVSKGIEKKISNRGNIIGDIEEGGVNAGNFTKSMNRLSKVLESGSSERKALVSIYGEKGVEPIDRVLKLIALEAKRSKGATVGSNTAALTADKKLLQGIPNTAGTRTVKMLDYVFNELPTRIGTKDVDTVREKIIIEALTSPEKAAALLRRQTPENVKKLEKTFGNILTGTLNSKEEEEKK